MGNNNVIKIGTCTIALNGGNELDGCPKSWDEAKGIIERFNNGKDYYEPMWSFDCGYKLDFDGPILSISSRFYPPKTHYGATWDGNVTVSIMGKEVKEKAFDCPTLDELKKEVDAYVKTLTDKMSDFFCSF